MRYIKMMFFVICFCLMGNLCAFAESSHSVEVKIPVSCKAKNIKDKFTYKLNSQTNEHQTIVKDTLQLKNKQSDAFVIRYTYPDVYHYEVYQVKGKKKNLEYDDRVYSVDVLVSSLDDGTLVSDVTIYMGRNPAKKEKCQFENHIDGGTASENRNKDKDANKNNGTDKNAINIQTGDIAIFGLIGLIVILVVLIVVLVVIRHRIVNNP